MYFRVFNDTEVQYLCKNLKNEYCISLWFFLCVFAFVLFFLRDLKLPVTRPCLQKPKLRATEVSLTLDSKSAH